MTTPAAAPRHAVYFAPSPRHPLWARGCRWLGRDTDDAGTVGAPAQSLVATPWRYGFHATLKAPMTLAEGTRESDWLDALQTLAARHEPFEMPPLRVAHLSDFIALRPVEPLTGSHALRRLADDCVTALDCWRAATGASANRRPSRGSLDERQVANLDRFGYPFVLDDWRFHMTLSNSLAGVEAERVAALCTKAEQHFAPALGVPLRCDHLCAFVEPAPGKAFELRLRVPLGAQ
jgi:hypothetical protein